MLSFFVLWLLTKEPMHGQKIAQEIVARNLPIIAWDYLEMIKSYNISFIVCRDQGIYPKFLNDPNFQVVYNSVEVAIFKVVEHK